MTKEQRKNPLILRMLESLDRRVIYLFIAISIAAPLIFKVVLPPAEMKTSDQYFEAIESLSNTDEKIVFVAADWGPGTQAENKPQTEVTIEHLMRKRVPFALISITPFATPFLKTVPLEVAEKLSKEMPGEKWLYGKDWVNLGFRPNASIMIQGIAKSKNILELLQTDANGAALDELPAMKKIRTLKDISMLVEITGLQGAMNIWVQFFQGDGYRPKMLHGCTSVSIPDAHIYLASGQIVGLFEGMAGAAWYDKLLSDKYSKREAGSAILQNTSLAIAQLVVIGLILLGNLGLLIRKFATKN